MLFSSIFTLAFSEIIITDEESSGRITSSNVSHENRTAVFNRARNEEPSFLTILDDKNRIIAGLKKQLQNQKMQLTYYMKRELSRNKILKLSTSCTPQASEESLPLTLALNKFCKQSGIKTKLLLLHERMHQLGYKISNSLKDQEFVLRKIINKLCEFVNYQEMSEDKFKDQFGRYINDPLHVNLFDKLLSATLSLRRKLDVFKICCDRVLIIEDERNEIVDQIYSLPIEDRISCNYLVGIQMEKAQLENEIRRISRHNDVAAKAPDRRRIKELNVMEKILYNLQVELSRSFLKNEGNCISKMLKKIDSEAKVLLERTKEQKKRFECDFCKIKCPELNRVLLFINLAAGDDKNLESYGIKTDKEFRIFQMIKKEIDNIKKKLKEESEKYLKKECQYLKNKVTEVLLVNSRTKLANKSLQQELNEIKTEQLNEIDRLIQERDAYKIQVEDLQAIREAYAQLVDRQPNIIEMEREFFKQVGQRDAKIMELEYQLSSQINEIERLKIKLADQSDQILVLNRFINLTRPNTPKFDSEESAKFCATTKSTNKSLSDGCCHKPLKKNNKIIKSEPVFTYCRRPKRASYKNLAKKKISYISDNIKEPQQNNSLDISDASEKESLTVNNRQSGDKVQRKMKMEKSSVFSVEIKYKNSDALYEIDEFEMFKDVSMESVL